MSNKPKNPPQWSEILCISVSLELSEDEKSELERWQLILHRGLDGGFDVGRALYIIREKRLYRATHPTFEAYCRQHLSISRSYAWRVIRATERLLLLPEEIQPRPENEFQIRPFLPLKPECFVTGWAQVVSQAHGGRITPNLIRAVARSLAGNASNRCPAVSRRKRRGRAVELPVGQILSIILEAKSKVRTGDADKALAALERIERLLLP